MGQVLVLSDGRSIPRNKAPLKSLGYLPELPRDTSMNTCAGRLCVRPGRVIDCSIVTPFGQKFVRSYLTLVLSGAFLPTRQEAVMRAYARYPDAFGARNFAWALSFGRDGFAPAIRE